MRNVPTGIVGVPNRLDLGDNENESEDIVGSIDVAMPIVLPSISAVQAMDETGRDLGLAKRVAHLVGKRPTLNKLKIPSFVMILGALLPPPGHASTVRDP
ncbi:hypothetical protein Tco_0217100 [Tanacetum coccineum]